MDLTFSTWIIMALGALLVGLGKGGIPGIGNLAIVVFASVFEPKASVGILLPVLIGADVVAVTVYRKHVDWPQLWRFMPWMLGGVGIGYLLLDRMDGQQVRILIGTIVLGMTLLQMFRHWQGKRRAEGVEDKLPASVWFRGPMGLLGGFATMVANAAGPVAQLYFLSVGLAKMAFIGTGAWCFFIVNLLKVPLMVDLGMITLSSAWISLSVIPVAMTGALIAPKVVRHIRQELFTKLIWFFIIVAGIKLLW